MKIEKVKPEEFLEIQKVYQEIIDGTKGMEAQGRWKKGLHPTREMVEAYIEEGSLYCMRSKQEILAVMAVTMYQGKEYREINWEIAAADEEVAVIHLLGVLPKYQKKGIGEAMIAEALALAKEQKKKACRLDVLESNWPAQHLYEKAGFQYRGRARWYAANTGWTDFWLYEVVLEGKEK